MDSQLNKKNDIKILRAVRLQYLEKGKQYEITLWIVIQTQNTGEKVLVYLGAKYKTPLPQKYIEDT